MSFKRVIGWLVGHAVHMAILSLSANPTYTTREEVELIRVLRDGISEFGLGRES